MKVRFKYDLQKKNELNKDATNLNNIASIKQY